MKILVDRRRQFTCKCCLSEILLEPDDGLTKETIKGKYGECDCEAVSFVCPVCGDKVIIKRKFI